jgi:uncharacterized membrane protein YecN with MAPEG domain
MGAALLVSLAIIAAALVWGSAQPFESRLATAVIAATVAAGWLAAGIANVARLRFLSPAAIDVGNTPDDATAQARAILQNTLEQVVLAIPVYVGLAVVFDRSMVAIAAMTGLFSAGRALFWAGYADGAAGRAFGFALTFYPSVVGLLLIFGTLLRNALV